MREKSINKMREALLTSEWFKAKYSKCFYGKDKSFIDTYIMPSVGKTKPLAAYKVFNLNRKGSRERI